LARKESGWGLYIPPKLADVFKPELPLVLTEGEKKPLPR
jgi:hypothetical protein